MVSLTISLALSYCPAHILQRAKQFARGCGMMPREIWEVCIIGGSSNSFASMRGHVRRTRNNTSMLCLTSGGVVSAGGNNGNIQSSPMAISGLVTEIVCVVLIKLGVPDIESKASSELPEKAREKSLGGILANKGRFVKLLEGASGVSKTSTSMW